MEDLPSVLATNGTTLLLGLTVPTHPSELSVLPTMRDQRCGSSPLLEAFFADSSVILTVGLVRLVRDRFPLLKM